MQASNQTNYAQKLEHIKILLSYKVFKCPRAVCPFEKQNGPFQFNVCEFYHDESDQRRFPFAESMLYFQKNDSLLKKFQTDSNYRLSDFINDTAGKSDDGCQKKIRLAYLNYLGTTSYSGPVCANLEELSFHPLNYKGKVCADAQECRVRFCPRYHSGEEKAEFNKLRDCFEDTHLIPELEMMGPRQMDHFDVLVSRLQSPPTPVIEVKKPETIPPTNNLSEKKESAEPVQSKPHNETTPKEQTSQAFPDKSHQILWKNLDAHGYYVIEPYTQNNQEPKANYGSEERPSQPRAPSLQRVCLKERKSEEKFGGNY